MSDSATRSDNITRLTPAAEPEAPTAPRRRGRGIRFWGRLSVALAVIGALAAWGALWARDSLRYVHETDARITADLIAVSSTVDGRVSRRPVEAGDRVARGAVLAVIDSEDAALQLAESEAAAGTVRAEIRRLDAEIAMARARIDTHIESARSRRAEAGAAVELARHELTYAEAEFRRMEALSASGAVPASRLDRSRADFLTARQRLVRARAAAATAAAAVAEAEAERGIIAVKQAEQARQRAELDEIDARTERQRLDLAERRIRSPIDGVVGRVFVQPGEYVTAGQRLMVVHDPAAVWIETNIRETEIDRVRVGQKVRVEVDAYPDRAFSGRVERIGHAATSQFALLPRMNESGTFTKVTQRLAVRIAVPTEGPEVLKPGMMVEVFIEAPGRPAF